MNRKNWGYWLGSKAKIFQHKWSKTSPHPNQQVVNLIMTYLDKHPPHFLVHWATYSLPFNQFSFGPEEDFKELILKGRPTAIEEIGKDFQTSFKGLRPVKSHRVKKNILASWNVKIMIDTQIKVLELQFIHLNVVKNSTRQVYQPTVHLQVWKEKSCLLHFLCQSLCLCYSLTDVPYHVECNFRQMIIFT